MLKGLLQAHMSVGNNYVPPPTSCGPHAAHPCTDADCRYHDAKTKFTEINDMVKDLNSFSRKLQKVSFIIVI